MRDQLFNFFVLTDIPGSRVLLDNKACKGKNYLDSDIKQDTLYQDDYILISFEGGMIEILENDNGLGYCDFCVLINLKHHADCFEICKFLVSDDFYSSLNEINEKYKDSGEIDYEAVSILQYLADRDIETSLEYIEKTDNNE